TLEIARKVLDDVRAWKGHGFQPRTSINLDARVAEEPSVGPTLIELVRERKLEPAQICLELTETAFPEDMTRLIEVMTRLRMAGFNLSLDDYGTGVSNFELLRLCPFTELKIDGSVMRSAPTEPIARRFIQSAVAMAHDLDMTVVGEGIETEAQLSTARQLGVTTIQGFLFSRPVSFEGMLRELSAAPPRLEARAC
ncbi:MAG: EAL domain-containing protein, partial [Mesorhizobium sp.]|nr:EAL domain-containing protein [Mesorhizobium sp.]